MKLRDSLLFDSLIRVLFLVPSFPAEKEITCSECPYCHANLLKFILKAITVISRFLKKKKNNNNNTNTRDVFLFSELILMTRKRKGPGYCEKNIRKIIFHVK